MSQLRQHLKFTWKHKLRAILQKGRLGKLGKSVHIDKSVEFMRFPKNIFVGDGVVVKEGARICSCNKNAEIKIGERSTIGYHNFIFASSKIQIGDDCLIAPFVYIVDSNHHIDRTQLINKQPNETAPISIGNGVWLASNVTVLKGVTIGEGAVVAANSVVNTNIPAFEIWGGSPAKKIGERK
jgi:acetyltransferase-like isoleucine patch superfamily enzyme